LALAIILTNSSGDEVPKATTVRPITKSEIFSLLAIEEEPSTRKSAPFISRTKPNTNNMYVHISFAILIETNR